jgi:hypothetical protein
MRIALSLRSSDWKVLRKRMLNLQICASSTALGPKKRKISQRRWLFPNL